MLLDTSGLLSYFDQGDANNTRAVELFDAADRLLTHSYVLAEFLPLCNARRMNRAAYLAFADPQAIGLSAIGGLLQDTWKHQISTMPGLGDIPILGALFRSRDYIHDQTELVIMVTPVLADTGRPELPTDTMQKAGDAEAIFLGQMEKNYGVGADGMRGGYSGSVGFVLD